LSYCVAAVTLPIAIAIAIAVAVAIPSSLRVKLGEHCPDHETPTKLQAFQRRSNEANAGVTRADNENGGSGGVRQQGRVGDPHHRRTIKDDKVEDLKAN
jgi:hypothetical protein